MTLRQAIWHVAIRRAPKGSILTDTDTPFCKVPNPIGCWAADPFLLERDGKLYIFAELFRLLRWKGELGYCVYENGTFSKWHTVFSERYHVSYPHLFERKGNLYMMPETNAISELSVYRAEVFPNRWTKDEVLIKGERIADATWVTEDTLIGYRMKSVPELVELKRKEGEAGFSIVSAVADTEDRLRPGGAVFEAAGKRYRIAQDGRERYGAAIRVMEILSKDGEAYSEQEVRYLAAKDLPITDGKRTITGIHTYNATDRFECIDYQYQGLSLLGLWKRFWMKIRKR